jgi:hypothetical protein
MSSFNFPSLLGPGYAALWVAVAAPIIIHLINMLRHRRVEWAAMEFLLLSHRKNRTWVRLKELLLLLMRIAVLVAIVMIVAQPLMSNQLGRWLGTSLTHHVVLLDDSFSMSDRWANTSAFDEAKKAIAELGAKAAAQPEPQMFTLIRFSRVARPGHGLEPDLREEAVGRERFVERLKETLARMRVSQTAVGPAPALRAIEQLLGEAGGQRRIVYLFSDFRAREWREPTELHELLKTFSEQDVKLHLVQCVDQVRPNLAITALEPAEGIQAAGVPFFMEVTVQNFGKAPAKNVTVLLEEDGHPRPPISIPILPPYQPGQPLGKSRTPPRFQVNFSTAGEHRVTAKLESDAVAADNYRHAVVNVPTDVPILLIDGDPEAKDARFIRDACAPGGAVRTGLRPQIETPRFLGLKSLDEFRAIHLLNVEHLERSVVESLERYLANGGGVAVFLGDRSQTKWINDELYRNGEGFFPVKLRGPADLPPDLLEQAADVEADEHFIFRVFADKRNPFSRMIKVQRYFAVHDTWRPTPDSTIEVIARLRNGAPLVVTRSFGRGRVVAFLTTAGPLANWNNWARTPSFVVVMHDLQAYLAARPGAEKTWQVGMPLELTLDPARYEPVVRFILPGEESSPTASIDATPRGNALAATYYDTDTSGVYQARLALKDGGDETRAYAFNVDSSEGDLQTVSKEHLSGKLTDVVFEYREVHDFHYALGEQAGYNLSEMLLYLLLFMLLGEQVLAWSASYHPPATGGKGGRR